MTIRLITAPELADHFGSDSTVIVDARRVHHYDAGHIHGAISSLGRLVRTATGSSATTLVQAGLLGRAAEL